MIYQTHRPGPPLSQFVDWFWFYDDCDLPHRKERVLPDGTFELVIDQAHFVNDFQGFSGLNPSAYLTQRGEYLNFVPMPG